MWYLENLQVHPYHWLRPDLVAPAPFLSCDPGITEDGSGVQSDPGGIDEQFRKAWFPSFCRTDKGSVDFSAYLDEFGGWLPSLAEVDFPPLLGSEFDDVVQREKSTSCSVDGWGWRDLQALPVTWFDWLAVVLTRVELDGTWLDGLLDA